MTQDDIIDMAREAGFEAAEYGLNCTPGMYAYNMKILERFAALVAAAEREACAEVCDGLERSYWNSAGDEEEPDAYDCAAAIRARGKQE